MTFTLDLTQWPDSFDFDTDPTCQSQFKPFIEQTLDQLKSLDQQRLALAPSEYIFHEHAPRVATMVRDFCLHLGLSETVANNMYWITLPHDAGKTLIADDRYQSTAHIWQEFAQKPTDDIFDLRRTHAKLGAEYIEQSFSNNNEANNHPCLSYMIDIAHYHHEYCDGSGPLGIDATRLSQPVRLVAIIEAFDGYSIKRAHFPPQRDTSPTGALAHMAKKTTQFDQDIFAAFSNFITQQQQAAS